MPWDKLAIIAEPIAIDIIPTALANKEPAQYLRAFSLGYIFISDNKLINIPSWISAVVTKIIGIIRFN